MASLEMPPPSPPHDSLGYLDFLQLLIQDEIERRKAKKLTLRLFRASFEEEKTLEGFDFTFNPKLNAKLIRTWETVLSSKRRSTSSSMDRQGSGKATWLKPWAIRHAG